MIPFSSFEFFVFMFAIIGLAVLAKQVCPNAYYKYVLALFNGFFLIAIFPQPIHFLLLIIYSYLTTYLLVDVFKVQNKLWGVLLLLFPLLIVKLDIRFEAPPFKLNNIISFMGFSYVVFKVMSYYMDRRFDQKMANIISYFNYLAFTPTILMGPIDRFERFLVSEKQGFEQITKDNFTKGWNAFLKGLVFKYIIAECISRYWLNYHPDLLHSKELLAMTNTMYSYYLYLVFDFSGYSWMALGIAKMMGMRVPLNFKHPLFAVNPQDYWKRFHISLGEWLKDYFFTPLFLFLSRKKVFKKNMLYRQNTALFSTFLLMGCWNGLNLRFIISGALFGLYSVVHNVYVVKCRKAEKDIVFGSFPPRIVHVISIFIMFNLAAFSFYIFSGYFPY